MGPAPEIIKAHAFHVWGVREDGLRWPMAALGNDEHEHDKCQHVASQACSSDSGRQSPKLYTQTFL